MKSKWIGKYSYSSPKAQKLISHPFTSFIIEVEIFKDNTLSGTVEDDRSTGGMDGKGIINGEVYEDSIYFEKKMPNGAFFNPKTNAIDYSRKKHPIIYYTGELNDEGSYHGTWEFEKQWTLLWGFIPVKYCPGKGTWEMTLAL